MGRITLMVVALLLAASGGMVGAMYVSLATLNLPAPAIDVAAARAAGAGAGAAAPATGPSRRLLVVLVDGLGAELAAAVPELGAIAARGAWAEISAEPPTYSSAQYVAFLTGVGPVDSGVRTNMSPRRTPLATVTDAVRARGGRAVEVGDEVDWWGRLFAWDEALVVAPERLLDAAGRLVDDPRNDLVLVHITGVDAAGHRRGAASALYRDAAAAAGRQVGALAARWGDRGPMVVLSDHGHMPRGGHGGSQPAVRGAFLVAAGAGVRAGARVTAPAGAADVAPTLAALLGVAPPAEAQGRTLAAILDVAPAAAAAFAAADAARAARVDAAAARRRAALLAAERRGRIARGAGLGVVLLLGAGALRRFRPGRPVLEGLGRGAAAAVLAACGILAAARGLPSFSAFRAIEQLGIAIGLVGVAAGLIALGGPFRAALVGRLAPAAAWRLAAGAAAGAAALAAAAFVATGLGAPRFTCRPDWLAAGPAFLYAASAGVQGVTAVLPLLAYLCRTRG